MLAVIIIQGLDNTGHKAPQQTFNREIYIRGHQIRPPRGDVILGLDGPLPVELAQALQLLTVTLERPGGIHRKAAPLAEGHLGQHAAGLVVAVGLLHVGEVLGSGRQRAPVLLRGGATPVELALLDLALAELLGPCGSLLPNDLLEPLASGLQLGSGESPQVTPPASACTVKQSID